MRVSVTRISIHFRMTGKLNQLNRSAFSDNIVGSLCYVLSFEVSFVVLLSNAISKPPNLGFHFYYTVQM